MSINVFKSVLGSIYVLMLMIIIISYFQFSQELYLQIVLVGVPIFIMQLMSLCVKSS